MSCLLEEVKEMRPQSTIVTMAERQNQRSSSPPPRMTNFLCLVKSVTPFVPVELLLDEESKVGKTIVSYSLSDLWEAFMKWSCYGRGVATLLNDKELVTQFYVPYLSAIQLYVDPFISETNGYGNSMRKGGHSINDESNLSNSSGKLIYEYFESEPPYNRMPLTNKALSLASQFPKLNTMKSSELLPTSWISVAWYPICRDWIGSTLKEIDTCFLTYHSLSTISTGYSPIKVNAAKKDRKPRISLPVLGVACHRYKGSLLFPADNDYECEKEKSLVQAAKDWIRDRNVIHPDFEFFRSH